VAHVAVEPGVTSVDTAPAAEPRPLAPPLLEVRNLEVGYGNLAEVIRGVSLTVPTGHIVTLLGPNGAGKTTLMRTLAGLLDLHDGEVRKGTVLLGGQDVTGAPAARLVASGVALVPEGRHIFVPLTVDENLRAGAHTRRLRGAELSAALDEVFELFPQLARRRDQRAGLLSGGEQQMLAVGRALMTRPRLLLLDEPSLGLAPRVVQEIRDVVVELHQRGTTVLLVEQNAVLALSIASHGYVMETGRIVLAAPAERLLANDDIKEFYLGLGGGGEGGAGGRRNFRDVKHYRRRKRRFG
jgi:branched-chain amino acid transport system ATP-binding protein